MVYRPSRRIFLATSGLIAVGAGGALAAAQMNDGGSFDHTVVWEGQGDEHAELDCPGEYGYWHWVLTPPGGRPGTPGSRPPLEEGAELTVTFEDDTEETVEGFRHGGGRGALHFDVYKEGGGTVEEGVVHFNGGGETSNLVISEGYCVADDDVEPELDVETRDATNVNGNSATLNGELTNMGYFEGVDVFFRWRAVGDKGWLSTDHQPYSETGEFDAEITGLEMGTEYEFMAVAMADANGDQVTGETLVFTKDEPDAPTIKTKPATDVNQSTAMLHGKLTDLGDYDEVSVFFEYRQYGTEDWEMTGTMSQTETGLFSAEIDGLSGGDKYEFRAVGTYNDSTVHGKTRYFDKERADPDVKTESASEVNGSTAMLNGLLESLGDYEDVMVFFEWRQTDSESWNQTASETRSETGSISSEIEGLETGKDYEFKAVATANDHRFEGDVREFSKDGKKKPDVENDVHLTAVCYEMNEDREVTYRVTNDTDHTLKFSWTLRDDEQGGKISVDSNDTGYFHATVNDEEMYCDLYFDGEMIATTDTRDVPHCDD